MKNLPATRHAEIWDPFAALRNLHEEMNRAFQRSLVAPAAKQVAFYVPDIDVKDEAGAVTVRADIPGMKKENLDISVQADLLTLKGERKEEAEKKGKDFYHAERFYGAFSRTIELPAKVKAAGVKASYKDGVLEVRLPKDASAQPKRTRIRIE
jgi:HSP20 family protein